MSYKIDLDQLIVGYITIDLDLLIVGYIAIDLDLLMVGYIAIDLDLLMIGQKIFRNVICTRIFAARPVLTILEPV